MGALAGIFRDGRTIATMPVFAQGSTPGVVAIRNATIITATRGTIANGTVLIRDGKIAAVGTNVSIPAGADVYDATGKFVSPGIIDAHSHIANDAINEGSVSVSSMTGMEDVLDPTDINIYRDLAGGTTTRQHPARQRQRDRRQDGRHQAALGQDARERPRLPGRAARHQVRPRRERHAQARPGADQPAALSDHAAGRRVRDPRRLHARQGLSQGVAGLRGEEEGRAGRPRAAPRSAARRARRGARGQAPRPRAQLPRRRDPDAHPHRRRDGLQDHDLPARPRGLQGRQGDRRAQRRRVHLLRLVGLQDGGGRRHSAQRLADDAQGRARLDQLGRCGAGAAAEHGSRQGRPLRRRDRRSGVRDGDDQSREAAQDRQPRRLDRSRQGRRPGRLEPSSAVDRRDRRAHLHRRHRLLRPREGSAAHRRHPEGEGRARDDRCVAGGDQRRRRSATNGGAGRRRGRRRRPSGSTSRATPTARPGRSPTRASSPSPVR